MRFTPSSALCHFLEKSLTVGHRAVLFHDGAALAPIGKLWWNVWLTAKSTLKRGRKRLMNLGGYMTYGFLCENYEVSLKTEIFYANRVAREDVFLKNDEF